MTWNRLAALSLVVATGAGALGLGWAPVELGETARTTTVLVCLVALGAFAGAFLAGLDRAPLLREAPGRGLVERGPGRSGNGNDSIRPH